MGAVDDLVRQLLAKKKKQKSSGRSGSRGAVSSAAVAEPVQPVTPVTGLFPVPSTVPMRQVQPVTPDAGWNPGPLPTVRASSGIAVPDPAAPAPVAVRKFLRTAPAYHDDRDRNLRDEKVLFVKLVEEMKNSSPVRLSDQSAVLEVVRIHSQSFPLLSSAGKNGNSALHYNNLRNWRDGSDKRPGLRNPVTGNVDYSRADLLLSNYGREYRIFGDERFWTQLLAACNNPSAVQIRRTYRQMVREWTRHSPDAEIPSLAQVYARIRKIPKRLLDLNRKGPNYYLQHNRDYIERDPDSIRPNEGWVGDTQMLDFMIRVKTGVDDAGFETFAAIRPWICVIMDIKSEHVVAWEMGIGSIDNRVIRNAFGRAVFQYGRPFIFQTDNGKDYLKKGFTTPVVFTPDIANSKVYSHSILISLEIEHRKAAAYNGRAKIVERFFSEMAKYYHQCRGYVGNSPANRKVEADVWTKPVTNEFLMGVEEACVQMANFIELFHSTPAVGSKFLKGMTPDEAFAPERRIKRPELSLAELYRRFLLPEPRPRTVDERGSSVQVDGRRYVTLLRDREKMWPYDGKPVMVKFDLASREYCFLFDLDGTFLTVAHRPRLIPYFCRTPEEKALLAQNMEWINGEIPTLNTYTSEMTNGFHKLDVSTSLGLPPEEFEAKARLRIVGKAHSVKGENHNPAVRVTAAEYRTRLLSKGEDISTVCTKTVQPVTPELVQTKEEKEFKKMLVTHLTDSEEPEETTLDFTQAFQPEPQTQEKNSDEKFNPYF